MTSKNIIIIFLSYFCFSISSHSSSLKCLESIDNSIIQQYPLIQFKQNVIRNRTIEIEAAGLVMNETIYTYEQARRFGTPSCIIYTAIDEPEVFVWFGVVSQSLLPFECNQTTSMQCIDDVPFARSPVKKNGFLCCCGYNQCNFRNPEYYAHVRNVYTPMTISFARFWFCLIFLCFGMIIFTVVEVEITKRLKNLPCFKKKQHVLEDLDMHRRNEDDYILSLDQTQYGEISEEEKAEKDSENRLQPEKRTQEVTEIAPEKIKKSSETAKMSADAYPEKTTQTQKKPNKPSFLFKNRRKKSENEPVSTEPTQEDEFVPLPPKPKVRMVGNRVQGISMNYDNSTFSDLV